MNSNRRCSGSHEGFGRTGGMQSRAAARADVFRHRNDDSYGQAAVGCVADIAAAAEFVRETSHDGESQSAMTIARARRVQAHKRLAGVFQALRRNAVAVIAYRDQPFA